MKRFLFFIIAALVAAFFVAAPASAQLFPQTLRVPCSGPELLPELLTREHGESVAGQGVAGGALVQLWRNPESGSWTILLVLPDGVACVLTSGDGWMDAAGPPLPAL